MVILENGAFEIKEEIPSARFWLMTKLRLGWDKKWEIYIHNLHLWLTEIMTVPGVEGTGGTKEKKEMADQIIAKLERSAWASMPAEFLKELGIDRVIIRH